MTRQLILQKALELFTDKGYEGSSMDDIAKAVGIRKASLYAHFDGKESIFTAIFEDILKEYVCYIGDLTAPRPGESTPDTLGRMFTEFILYCHNNLKMYFWDRYFYYPPAFIRDTMQRRTMETQDAFFAAHQPVHGAGHAKRRAMPQPVVGAALAYYYLMIGLSMSVKLYSREALLSDTRSAWKATGRAWPFHSRKGGTLVTNP